MCEILSYMSGIVETRITTVINALAWRQHPLTITPDVARTMNHDMVKRVRAKFKEWAYKSRIEFPQRLEYYAGHFCRGGTSYSAEYDAIDTLNRHFQIYDDRGDGDENTNELMREFEHRWGRISEAQGAILDIRAAPEHHISPEYEQDGSPQSTTDWLCEGAGISRGPRDDDNDEIWRLKPLSLVRTVSRSKSYSSLKSQQGALQNHSPAADYKADADRFSHGYSAEGSIHDGKPSELDENIAAEQGKIAAYKEECRRLQEAIEIFNRKTAELELAEQIRAQTAERLKDYMREGNIISWPANPIFTSIRVVNMSPRKYNADPHYANI